MHFKHSLLSLNGNNVFKAVLKKKKKFRTGKFSPPKINKTAAVFHPQPLPDFLS